MSEWIDCSKELPPCDNYYDVDDGEEDIFKRFIYIHCFYDGYGFKFAGETIYPKFWRHSKRNTVKKYGKTR